jgi:hypothetical protein
MEKIKYTDFLDDGEKMDDFLSLSKIEFLASYSYLEEEEYELTTQRLTAILEKLPIWTS